MAPRQADREFGECASLAVDRDRAAMLLGDDVVADRETEAGALSRRFCREERLKKPVAVFGRDAGAIVAHPDLDGLAKIARRDLQHRAERAIRVAALFGSGIEAIADQVQQDPGDVLRHDLDRCKVPVEVAFHRDVEALILGAGAMIGEVERLFDERVDVGRLPITAAAARMRQHAFDDPVGAAPVLGDFAEVPGEHLDDFIDLGVRFLIERGHGWLRRLLQLVQQLDREVGEIIDEVERVLDLVSDAGRELAKGRHLLRMQEAGLCRLQFPKRPLGGVAAPPRSPPRRACAR